MLSQKELEAIISRHFRVYDTQIESLHGRVEAYGFCLMAPADEFQARFEAARAEISQHDPEALCILRSQDGEDVLLVARRPPPAKSKLGLQLVLLFATVATTTAAGAMFWRSYADDSVTHWMALLSPPHLLNGLLWFSLPLMAILGVHEMAHFIAARRHGLRASLPFFLPIPPGLFPFGTLGAFISMRDPMPNRKALFDVGVSGPLAGFAVAIPVVLVGAMLTSAGGIEAPDWGRPEITSDANILVESDGPGSATVSFLSPRPGEHLLWFEAPPLHERPTGTEEGTPWTFTASLVVETTEGSDHVESFSGTIEAGEQGLRRISLPDGVESAKVAVTWDDGLISFGDPLLVTAMRPLGLLAEGMMTHPTFIAGWVGLLVTGINLLPVGQLDGGHVARAVLGDRMKIAAYAAMALVMVLVLVAQAWMFMAILILLMGANHPPPLNDRDSLGRGRMILTWVALAVLILTFVPRPIIL